MRRSVKPIVFGATYSVYVRSVRLALAEKGVSYDLVDIDVFALGGPPSDYLERHPFGRIPAFEHAGFRLYEARAIMGYVDEAFTGPSLQPSGSRERARMVQAMSVLDSYAYRTLVWDIYVERITRSASGGLADEDKIAAALPKAAVCLRALAQIMDQGAWLAGTEISLADLLAAPMFARFRLAPEGERLLDSHPELRRWWERMSQRSSMAATEAPSRRAATFDS